MCVMAGIGVENGYALKALDSVKERLETPYGIVLNDPPYYSYNKNLGEITSYPPIQRKCRCILPQQSLDHMR